MKSSRTIICSITLLSVFILAGCSVVSAVSPTQTPTFTLQPEKPTPTITPTATEIPFLVNALVWDETKEIPILIYHQFVPDYMNTDATQMRLSDFREELQSFYDSGFSLIPLKDWLEGDFVVPEGRKPMVLTMDDLWFGNQLFILDDGTPSLQSGLGILWQFYQEHPDFGFHGALFAIYGDKFYPEKQVGEFFYAADGVNFFSNSWHVKLGNTIAWALQNGLEVYNHTFLHPAGFRYVDRFLTNAEINEQLAKNDYWQRQFLIESGHEDLIPQLDNMIALPEGKWPETESGKNTILNYKNDEGEPVLAIMEAYNMDSPTFTPSRFSDKFDPFHIARITASKYMTQYIVENKDLAPTITQCQLGPIDESQASDINVIQAAIQTAVNSQACPQGVYNVNGNVFRARDGTVTLIIAANSADELKEPTPTPTVVQ